MVLLSVRHERIYSRLTFKIGIPLMQRLEHLQILFSHFAGSGTAAALVARLAHVARRRSHFDSILLCGLLAIALESIESDAVGILSRDRPWSTEAGHLATSASVYSERRKRWAWDRGYTKAALGLQTMGSSPGCLAR